jgi:hypothetical protein
MGIRLRRVNPFDMREPIVEFFWRIKMWPYASKDAYFRLWDWRYRCLSETDPAVWVATAGDTVVGHIAVHFRYLSVNGQRLCAGVPGNFRVDEAHRNVAVGAALASAPRMLVQRKEIDLLTGYGNRIAHAMSLAMGFRDLGAMQTLIHARRWAPILRRRSFALGFLSPLVSLAAGVHQRFRRTTSARIPDSLTARPIVTEELAVMDRSHWQRGAGLRWDGSMPYFASRFGSTEFRATRVFGIIDSHNGRLEGLVAIEGTEQVNVLECDTNESVLSAVQAVELVMRAIPDAESVRVALLPQSHGAADFAKAGYLRMPAAASAPTIRDTFWSSYWLAAHPLASALAATDQWNMWYGWSHH